MRITTIFIYNVCDYEYDKTGKCPVGIATQDSELPFSLHINHAVKRFLYDDSVTLLILHFLCRR